MSAGAVMSSVEDMAKTGEGVEEGAGDDKIAEPCQEGRGDQSKTCPQMATPASTTQDEHKDEAKKPPSGKNKKKKKKKSTQQAPATNLTNKTEISSSEVTSVTKSTFDQELDWCIGQLELGMLRPGASKSQKQQNEKNIHSLQSSKTSIPKKRQLMRSIFGDYRSKMKSRPLPESLVAKETKLEPAKAEVIETVGTYYRRSSGMKAELHEHDFKFDFNIT